MSEHRQQQRVNTHQCEDCSATTIAARTGEARCLECRGGRLEPELNAVWTLKTTRAHLGVVCDFLGISHSSGKLTKGDLLTRISKVTLTGPPALDDENIMDALAKMSHSERQKSFPEVWKQWQNKS